MNEDTAVALEEIAAQLIKLNATMAKILEVLQIK